MELQVERVPLRAGEVVEGDETLLARGRPVVRVGTFGETAVSVGVSTPAHAPVIDRARVRGLPVVRRGSGGTGLLHLPGDVFWSVVLPRQHPALVSGFVHRYAELGAGWPTQLAERGVPASWDPALARSRTYCLLGERGSVLAVGGRALGGASQHATARALLHHGVVAASLDPRALGELFDLEGPLVAGSLTSLRQEGVDLRPRDLPLLAERLASALEGGPRSPGHPRGSPEP